MATPLADLLRSVLTDDTVGRAAGRSPSAFLRDHGWDHLDVADLREAMLVLADGAPTAEATAWVAGSDVIDPDSDLDAALTAVAETFRSDLVADDPFDVDDIDTDHDTDIDHDTELDELDGIDDTRDADPAEDAAGLEVFGPIELDEPEQFATPLASPLDDVPDPGEFGDGWDDLI